MSESATMKAGPEPALWLLLALLLAYAVLIALPFVPGVELGLTLMMVEGAWISPLIWAATLLGLMMSFFVGFLLPYGPLKKTLTDLRLGRAADLIATIEPLERDDRLNALRRHLPRWLSPLAKSQRYILLAVLINLPGNSILGGGGGILLLAGVSRLFSPVATIATAALAVAPVPVLVFLIGEGLPLPGF